MSKTDLKEAPNHVDNPNQQEANTYRWKLLTWKKINKNPNHPKKPLKSSIFIWQEGFNW